MNASSAQIRVTLISLASFSRTASNAKWTESMPGLALTGNAQIRAMFIPTPEEIDRLQRFVILPIATKDAVTDRVDPKSIVRNTGGVDLPDASSSCGLEQVMTGDNQGHPG